MKAFTRSLQEYYMQSTGSIVILVLTSLAGGCSWIGPLITNYTDSADESLTILEEAYENTAPPHQVALQTDPPNLLVPPEPVEPLPEFRFDMTVDDAQAGDFFRSLVVDTPYNMVVHPDVAGSVTLSLKDVSVMDVMEVMRDVYGYDYTFQNNVFQVFPDALRTEIYHLNYLNVSRRGSSEVQVSAGKVSDQNNGGGGANNSNNSYNNTGGGQSGQVVGTIVNTDAESDLWLELSHTLEALVAQDEGGRVVITPQVGLVVVTALPKTLRAISSYINQVEDTLTRQVVLEAKVIEVTLNEGFEAGIDWNTFGDAAGGVAANSERSVAGALSSGITDGFNPLGGSFSLTTAFGDFESTISLLRTQGSVQVLSSPRIATVNNQKAVIKVGSDEFFVTDISSNTVTAGSAINTNDSPELTPFFSGIALDVTPQISSEEDVILHVHPTVSEVTEQIKQIGGEDVPLAASTIRESDSIVKAHNGQIVVIGGLMQNSSKDDNAGVPWLRRLPLVGNIFKQKVQRGIKSELVILLKPMVVGSDSQQPMLSKSARRVRDIRALMRERG
ncbi:MAG: pilus (MSHA type) biogenesis protein MshL [Pseudomonadota bacterium]